MSYAYSHGIYLAIHTYIKDSIGLENSRVNSARRQFLLAITLTPWAMAFAETRPVAELNIYTAGDELAFRPDLLMCRANTRVRLFLHHTGQILNDFHDWVLLKPGSSRRFLADADRQANTVVPPHDRSLVLAATGLCGKGQTVMVEFDAPAPGRYPFMCSVPGHGETMRGVLIVTT